MLCNVVYCILFLTFGTVAPSTLGPLISRPALYHLRLPVQTASWYHLPGQMTASGVEYGGMTAAHRSLRFGEVRTLCRQDHPLICASVKIVDRGPFVDGREWDVSKEVAKKLHFTRRGLLAVRVTGER